MAGRVMPACLLSSSYDELTDLLAAADGPAGRPRRVPVGQQRIKEKSCHAVNKTARPAAQLADN